jgi:hypothetical protein
MTTKAELKQELDALGIDYPGNARKDELAALLEDALEPETLTAPADFEPVTVGESAQSFADATRAKLCRQCGKPSDHLHKGV